MYLNYPKNTLYKYGNKVTASIWSNEGDKYVKSKTINFRSVSHPIERTENGYEVYEAIIDDVDPDIAELVGLSPSKLPWYNFYPFYPTGKTENSTTAIPGLIKSVKCDQVFSTTEDAESSDGWLMLKKEVLNKVVGFETKKIDKNKIRLIRIESRKKVVLKGKFNGKGTETTSYYLISGSGELFEEKRSFQYEYRSGFGIKRRTFYAKGEYIKRLEKKETYSKPTPTFPELTSQKNDIPYFTDKDGLFIPVTLNDKLSVKMFVEPLLKESFIDYEYYLKNYEGEPKDYLYPFNKLTVGKNKIDNPPVTIKKTDTGTRISYKIPGIIGNDILSKGILYINDKKRLLSLYENDGVKEPKDLVRFEIIDGYPIFEVMVNSSPIKATLSFGNIEPVISEKLKNLLSLKTREIAISSTNCDSCSISKAQIIITPIDRPYFKTEAVVADLSGKPYDLILGLEYLKEKELLINYKDKWFSIN